MTTVAQMIEWLKTLPQDAEVWCGEEEWVGYDLRMVHSPVYIESCSVLDYTKEKTGHLAGKVIVKLNT